MIEEKQSDEKKKSDWTVLDGKFLNFVVFGPLVIYFVPRILFGINAPFIRSVETAERLVPKLAKDMEFVTKYYSAAQAREFVLFFANLTLITMVLAITAIIVRLAFFRNEPYSFRNRTKPKHKKYLPIYPVVFAVFIFFISSPFKMPDEFSTAKFGPGLIAILISSLLIMVTGIIFYVITALYFTGGLKGIYSGNTQENAESGDGNG